MRIELAWIGPRGPVIRELDLDAAATVADALNQAAQEPAFAGAALQGRAVGIFGRIVTPERRLAEGDRLEIYRGPAVDPKLARRARAKAR